MHYRSLYLVACLCMTAIGLAGCWKQQALQPVAPQPPVETQPVETQPVEQTADDEIIENEQPEDEGPKLSDNQKSLKMCNVNPDCLYRVAYRILDDENNPNDDKAAALRALAQVASIDGQRGEARLFAESALELNPNDVESLKILAVIAHWEKRDNDALKYIRTAENLLTKEASVYSLKSAILQAYLDTDRALEAAQKAVELAPTDCVAIAVYADALYATQAYADAVAQYEKADKLSCPAAESALKNMAKIYEVHVASPKEACKTYERLLEIDPKNDNYKASRNYQCAQTGE